MTPRERKTGPPAKTEPPEREPAVAKSVAPGRESLLEFADAVNRLPRPETVTAPVPELHLVTFDLEREEFGVPIHLVREIIRVADVTRVPEAPPHIRGVTNLRGRILPVVEIRTRLGLPAAVPTARSRIVVVESRGRVLGILVDAVRQVLKLPVDVVLPPPPEVVSAQADYFRGVARLGARLVILLDLDKVLLLPETATP